MENSIYYSKLIEETLKSYVYLKIQIIERCVLKASHRKCLDGRCIQIRAEIINILYDFMFTNNIMIPGKDNENVGPSKHSEAVPSNRN